jgi:hypothetical protein
MILNSQVRWDDRLCRELRQVTRLDTMNKGNGHGRVTVPPGYTRLASARNNSALK